jgi:hypothetical protein
MELIIVLFIVMVIILALLGTASGVRPGATQGTPRFCPGCELNHPSFASFCRKCGKKL